jgi:hypothetical protein
MHTTLPFFPWESLGFSCWIGQILSVSYGTRRFLYAFTSAHPELHTSHPHTNFKICLNFTAYLCVILPPSSMFFLSFRQELCVCDWLISCLCMVNRTPIPSSTLIIYLVERWSANGEAPRWVFSFQVFSLVGINISPSSRKPAFLS